jgi:hypothetical protein
MRGIRAPHAAVVTQKGSLDVWGAFDQVGEDAYAVAYIRVDLIQAARPALLPFPLVERHHLHQASRPHKALRSGSELDILSEEDPNQQGGTDILSRALSDDSRRDFFGSRGVFRVFEQSVLDTRDLELGFLVSWRGVFLRSRRGGTNERGGQFQQLTGFHELRFLLADGPDRSRRKEDGGTYTMKCGLEDLFPAGCRWPWWSTDRHVNKRISGSFLALIELEVGHAPFGCTSHATPGMEIALPPVPYLHYTESK